MHCHLTATLQVLKSRCDAVVRVLDQDSSDLLKKITQTCSGIAKGMQGVAIVAGNKL